MTREFENLFTNLTPAPEPPPGLIEGAMARIRKERFRTAVLRKAVWAGAALLSGLGLGFAGHAAWIDASGSGFIASSTLLFTDPGIVAAYWDKFLLALLEALPAASVAVLCVSLAAFLGSTRELVRSFLSSAKTRALPTGGHAA